MIEFVIVTAIEAPLSVERSGQQHADLVEVCDLLALAVQVVVGIADKAMAQLADQLIAAVLQRAVGRADTILLHIILCPGMGKPLFIDLGIPFE
ncbi:hypothetical protein D3C76_1598660 [compost metagenome]